MPIWLATFLTKLIEPIVTKLFTMLFSQAKIGLINVRLSKLEKNHEDMSSAIVSMAKAETDEESDAALKAYAQSRNHP